MFAIAKTIADQLISQYGPGARDRALALADATRSYGNSECAEFYWLVARAIATVGADPEHAVAMRPDQSR